MDLFIHMMKADKDGNKVPIYVFGGEDAPDPYGMMRVSHRALDEKLSTDYLPVQSHLKEELLSPGEIVPVDIEISVSSRIWHKGEKIRIIAVCRMLLTAIWHILTDLKPYTPDGYLEPCPVNKEKTLTTSQALNLLRQRGYTISDDPVAAS